jgi:3-dehydroquinate synthase
MNTIRFKTEPDTTTDYVVGPGARNHERMHDALGDRPVAVIVDEQVEARHPLLVADLLDGRDCLGVLALPGGEQVKSFAQLESILEFLESSSLPKHGVVVAVGGGTICDVAGVAAMLLRRSVPLVLVPTTLLAQVDAAVGGKNGINTGTTKNLIGHFYHPAIVACDQSFLTTLPTRQVVSGIAECIKVFAVADACALATHIPRLSADADAGAVGSLEPWRDAVWDAVRWKLHLLEDDPYERSSRRLLNYGHAFAHMFEERSNYRILHGEAVLLGMMIENEISAELDIAGPEVLRLQDTIAGHVSPIGQECWVTFDELGPELQRLRRMRRNALNLVCLREPGDAAIVDDLPDDVLEVAWSRVEKRLAVGSARRWAGAR